MQSGQARHFSVLTCGSPLAFDGCRAAAFETAILGNRMRLPLAARAAQSRDALFTAPGVDLQELRDTLERFVGADRALACLDLAGDEFLGKREAARLAASATVRAGQQLVGRLDPRVFIDLEKPLRDREYRPEEQADTCHDCRRCQHTAHAAL